MFVLIFIWMLGRLYFCGLLPFLCRLHFWDCPVFGCHQKQSCYVLCCVTLPIWVKNSDKQIDRELEIMTTTVLRVAVVKNDQNVQKCCKLLFFVRQWKISKNYFDINAAMTKNQSGYCSRRVIQESSPHFQNIILTHSQKPCLEFTGYCTYTNI